MLIGGRSSSDNETEFTNVAVLFKCLDDGLRRMALQTLETFSMSYPSNTLCQDISSFIGFGGEKTIVPAGRRSVKAHIPVLYPEPIATGLRIFIKNLQDLEYINLSGGIVHAPSAEWVTPKLRVSNAGETKIKNLFFIGDGSGKTQGIVSAAVMGIRAARQIMRKQRG
jgi:uncharacterized FAD-dependent dehydrogenase